MTQSFPFPSLVNRPSLIEYKQYRFLVMDAPTDSNLHVYVDILKKKHVTALVRACEPTYKTSALVANGIPVLDLPFEDGDPPPEHMLTQWLQLVHECFGSGSGNGSGNGHGNNEGKEEKGMGLKNSSSKSLTSPVAQNQVQHSKQNGQAVAVVNGVTGTTADGHTTSNGASNGATVVGMEKKCIGVHCVAGLGRAPVLVAIALIEAGMQPFEAIEFIRKKRRGAINARQLKYLENYKPRKRKAKNDGGCVIC